MIHNRMWEWWIGRSWNRARLRIRCGIKHAIEFGQECFVAQLDTPEARLEVWLIEKRGRGGSAHTHSARTFEAIYVRLTLI